MLEVSLKKGGVRRTRAPLSPAPAPATLRAARQEVPRQASRKRESHIECQHQWQLSGRQESRDDALLEQQPRVHTIAYLGKARAHEEAHPYIRDAARPEAVRDGKAAADPAAAARMKMREKSASTPSPLNAAGRGMVAPEYPRQPHSMEAAQMASPTLLPTPTVHEAAWKHAPAIPAAQSHLQTPPRPRQGPPPDSPSRTANFAANRSTAANRAASANRAAGRPGTGHNPVNVSPPMSPHLTREETDALKQRILTLFQSEGPRLTGTAARVSLEGQQPHTGAVSRWHDASVKADEIAWTFEE